MIIIVLLLYFLFLCFLLLKINAKAVIRCSESDQNKIEQNKSGIKWRKVPQYKRDEKIKLLLILINMMIVLILFQILF
jgi:hypothetical protein